MAETRTLAQKLGIKPGQKLLVLNAPVGYVALLGSLPDGAALQTEGNGLFDFVQAFVHSKADVDRLAPMAIQAVKPDGLLWFSYPKKTGRIRTDISRDTGWDAVSAADLLGVTQISVDETWSALRFRPRQAIKKLTRKLE